MDPNRNVVFGITLAVVGTLSACASSGGNQHAAAHLAAAVPGTLSQGCEAIAGRLAFDNTEFTSVRRVTAGELKVAGQPIGEHCLVGGRMYPRTSPVDGKQYAVGFEIRLPVAWNGRFFHQANGGIDGSVVPATGPGGGGGELTNALLQGFAVISSDAGHGPTQNPTFGFDPQARLDYGYQAVGKLTPMARKVIQTAYGRDPDRSYFGGCSNGGRHALVAATRYPDQYDGFIVGSPGYNLPKAAMANIFGAQQYLKLMTPGATTTTKLGPNTLTVPDLATGLTGAERALVARRVLDRCDALDGVRDGLVQDVKACQSSFDLERDVATCSGARNGQCLTAEQKRALGSIHAGPKTANGKPLYNSFPFDAGIAGADALSWEYIAPLTRDAPAGGVIFLVPPTPMAELRNVVATPIDVLNARIHATDATYTESSMSFMTPPNPTDLSRMKARGARMIAYHGVSDQIFSADDTRDWYEGLAAANGGDAAGFVRYFPVPSMNHCRGGPATDQFDMLTPLVKWVEQGIAPGSVIATARGAGNPGGVNPEVPADWSATRTRPLCPYPKVARYAGSGSIEEAGSFSCR